MSSQNPYLGLLNVKLLSRTTFYRSIKMIKIIYEDFGKKRTLTE